MRQQSIAHAALSYLIAVVLTLWLLNMRLGGRGGHIGRSRGLDENWLVYRRGSRVAKGIRL